MKKPASATGQGASSLLYRPAPPHSFSPASAIADADEIPLPPHLPSGMEARRVKTRLKPGFQRQPTARSRRETANHWAADQQSLSVSLLHFS